MSETSTYQPTIFEETQTVSPAITLLVGTVAAFALGSAWFGTIRDGSIVRAAPGLLLGTLAAGVGVAFVALSRLITRVTPSEAVITYRPFKRIRLGAADIADVKPKTFGLLDGGIGFHIGFRSLALTATTGTGVVITRPDGRTILVGTQRPDALLAALAQLRASGPR